VEKTHHKSFFVMEGCTEVVVVILTDSQGGEPVCWPLSGQSIRFVVSGAAVRKRVEVVDPVVLYNSTVRLVIVMLLCAAACFCGVGLVCNSFCCFGTVHNCCA
jgi:hypothetical protein